jgi:hypothetical protein
VEVANMKLTILDVLRGHEAKSAASKGEQERQRQEYISRRSG